MQRVRDQVLQVAPARSTVLIQGESASARELVAKAIHYNSTRRTHPFIAHQLLRHPGHAHREQAISGHERGAFTGAVERQRGRSSSWLHARTIFLDEIGEMDLRPSRGCCACSRREFMRVGGSRSVRVDVRVLAATNPRDSGSDRGGRFPPGPLFPG